MRTLVFALAGLTGCDFAFAVRPAGYVDGRPAVVKQGDLELVTDGIAASSGAKNVATILDLKNAGREPILIEEVDLVAVDGVAIAGLTQHAKTERDVDPEPRAPGLDALPLTLAPGALVRIAVRWRLARELDLSCADRCTLVLKRRSARDQPSEMRVDLLDHPPAAWR